MIQPSLLPDPRPPTRDGIDLRCCSCEDLRPETVPDVVVADPPWSYHHDAPAGVPADHYACLSTEEIARHARDAPGRLLVLWCTWPLLPEWTRQDVGSWRWVSGGAWIKPEDYGPGYWWSGCSEPVLICVRDGAHNDRRELRNAHVEHRGEHSAKPVEWQAQMLRRWCPPGGLVLDLYAGLGSVARAVLRAGEGRRYLGAEIDPERHARAMSAIAMERG